MEQDNRFEQIFNQITRLVNADFQEQSVPSEKGDDLDSIIVGLNVLGEELEYNILQLKESQDKISYTLKQLSDAQHIAQIGSWEWNVIENKISWTDELYRIYGRSKENFESNFENFITCIHPEDRDYVKAIIHNAFQEKKPFAFAHRSIRPDGIEIFLDCKGSVFLEGDEIVRMTGTAQDVSELKKAQEKITWLASIVECSSDAIMSKTTDGYLTSWNKQAENLFGYTEKEILGQHVSLLFPKERLIEEKDILKKINEGNTLINFETERKKKNGTVFPVALTISPIKNPTGKIIGISKIVRDITEKKLYEEKLIEYTKVLEHKNKEAVQFAYVASHDLQEPLRTISNYISLFAEEQKGQMNETAENYLTVIARAAKRMQVLVTDLLEYSRIGNDSTDLEINCNELVKDILKDIDQTIVENKATIELDNFLPIITGKLSGIRSLFQNLISNAIKFRKKDAAPVIKISAKDQGKHWLFEIKDNGIGIEKIYFDKIFMLFQRLHTRNEYQGTGIGFALCKKVIDMRGGKIWIESEYGIGTTFYFTIPKIQIV
jgi:PAS domain S-box-containing protein